MTPRSLANEEGTTSFPSKDSLKSERFPNIINDTYIIRADVFQVYPNAIRCVVDITWQPVGFLNPLYLHNVICVLLHTARTTSLG